MVCFSALFLWFSAFREITIPDISAYDPSVHLNFNDIVADNPTSP